MCVRVCGSVSSGEVVTSARLTKSINIATEDKWNYCGKHIINLILGYMFET